MGKFSTSGQSHPRGKALKNHVHFVEKIKKKSKKSIKKSRKNQKEISYAFFSSALPLGLAHNFLIILYIGIGRI